MIEAPKYRFVINIHFELFLPFVKELMDIEELNEYDVQLLQAEDKCLFVTNDDNIGKLFIKEANDVSKSLSMKQYLRLIHGKSFTNEFGKLDL
jgi:hypothetical protein